jgi:hypothetical protein
MKIVINKCFGGFGLSHEAVMLYAEKKGIKLYFRNHPSLPNSDLFVQYCRVSPEEYNALEAEYSKKKNGIREFNELGLYFSSTDIERNDPILVQTVEELGDKANTRFSDLKVVEIPDGVQWEIDEYDGIETVHEVHRSWS